MRLAGGQYLTQQGGGFDIPSFCYAELLLQELMGVLSMLEYMTADDIVELLILKGKSFPFRIDELLMPQYLDIPATVIVAVREFIHLYIGAWMGIMSTAYLQYPFRAGNVKIKPVLWIPYFH